MNYKPDISADEALQRLIDGNERFLRSEAHLSGVPRETMPELVRGSIRSRQYSVAAVLLTLNSQPSTLNHLRA